MIIGIEPNLQRENVRRVVMNFSLLRRAEGDVGAAAVGSPSFTAGACAEIGVGVGDAFVDLILKRVFRRTGVRIPQFPEILDETIALIVRGELKKCFSLIAGDEICDVALEPFLVTLFQLFGLFLLLGRGEEGSGRSER